MSNPLTSDPIGGYTLSFNLRAVRTMLEMLGHLDDANPLIMELKRRFTEADEALLPGPARMHADEVCSPELLRRVIEAANTIPFDWSGNDWVVDILAGDDHCERWTKPFPEVMRVVFKLVREGGKQRLLANEKILKEWKA